MQEEGGAGRRGTPREAADLTASWVLIFLEFSRVFSSFECFGVSWHQLGASIFLEFFRVFRLWGVFNSVLFNDFHVFFSSFLVFFVFGVS